MKIEVLLFAAARERLGRDRLTLEVEDGETVGDLRGRLRQGHPELSDLLNTTRIAIGTEYCTDQVILKPGDQAALIPPVSGG